MAQLSDDCFAFGGELMRADAALGILAARVSVVAGQETAPLAAACGRILAEDVAAHRNVPPHDNAAVDGFAVYYDDLAPGADTCLPVVGRIAAGGAMPDHAARGAAVRVFTGAPMPPGPDTVIAASIPVGRPATVTASECSATAYATPADAVSPALTVTG